MKRKEIVINADEFWVKIVDFLQQNWALIEVGDKITVWFIHDASGVFDQMEFETVEQAEAGLSRNGFKKYLDPNQKFTQFIGHPKRPFFFAFPRKIYSSGEFWRGLPPDNRKNQ
ncbi:hypothetical protein ACFLR1_01620 [Bacteroidota bacterium]